MSISNKKEELSWKISSLQKMYWLNRHYINMSLALESSQKHIQTQQYLFSPIFKLCVRLNKIIE